MSILTKEVQESTPFAGSNAAECTLEIMVLKIKGGEGQAVRSLAEALGNSLPDRKPLPARWSIEAVLSTYVHLQSMQMTVLRRSRDIHGGGLFLFRCSDN